MTRRFSLLLVTFACADADLDVAPDPANTPLAPRAPLRYSPEGTTFAGIRLAAEGLATAWQPGCELLATVDCDRATARVDGDTIESWTSEREGSHHRFLLRDPAREPLSLRLPVRGAKLEQRDEETIALTTLGRTFLYAGLVARDEAGTVLPTRMEALNDAIVLHVDATQSVGWIDVDPLLTESDLSHYGTRSYGYFGSWVSAAGDNNADGFGDIVSHGNGNAYWLPGGPDGTTYSSAGFLQYEDATLSGFLAVGGMDVNGDGVDDVFQRVNQLGFQIAFGVPGGVPANQPLRPRYQPSTIIVGDFNGDGIGDLVEGSGASTQETLLITHGAPNIQTKPANRLLGNLFPPSVPCVSWTLELSVGDANGDGYDDLLVNIYDRLDEGHLFTDAKLFLGSRTGLPASPAWTWLPQDPSGVVGDVRTVRFAGDLDGDGLDDIVAAGSSHAATEVNRVWWLPGADLTGEPRLIGSWLGWRMGASNCGVPYGHYREDYTIFANGVGDINGDGYDVLKVSNTNDGTFFLGGPDGPLHEPYWEIQYVQPVSRHYSNYIGDVNGDGIDDLAIFTDGQWDEDPTQAGSLDLYWGRYFPDIDLDGSPNELDCDPHRDDVAPHLPEIPGTDNDNDCDGQILCWVDLDGDGVGGTLQARPFGTSCTDPGYLPDGGDCDDDDPTLSPSLPELPDNERDEDCDGYVGCHVDRDGDGFGGLELLADCASDPDWTLDDQDCDDAQAGVSPAATEVPGSGFDDDCDGIAACFEDPDGDGAGIAGTVVWSPDASCVHPGMGYLVDCDEGNPNVSPHATEQMGDNTDQNCDGLLACWEDLDGDGYGTPTVVITSAPTCGSPGASFYSNDCAPDDPGIFPNAVEVPANGIDENCTGIDAGWADIDGDGFARVGAQVREVGVTMLSPAIAADCDDILDFAHPGAVEYHSNDVDEDCNGMLTCLVDADGDGFGACLSPDYGVESPSGGFPVGMCTEYYIGVEIPLNRRCGVMPGTSAQVGDCNDASALEYPGEGQYDRPDNWLDEDCRRTIAGYEDLDGDGYGAVITPASSNGRRHKLFEAAAFHAVCPGPQCTFVTRGGDCDDADPLIHPGRAEVLGDGVDENCNDATTPRLTLLEGPGRRLRLVGRDFPPQQSVRLDVSRTAPSSTTCPSSGPCALLPSPTTFTGQADALGDVTIVYDLPSAMQFGAPYWFHLLAPPPGMGTEVIAWTDTPTLSVVDLGDRYIQIDVAGLRPNTTVLLDRTTNLNVNEPCVPTAPCRRFSSVAVSVRGTTDAQGRRRWTFRLPYDLAPLSRVRFQAVGGNGPENATNVVVLVVPNLAE